MFPPTLKFDSNGNTIDGICGKCGTDKIIYYVCNHYKETPIAKTVTITIEENIFKNYEDWSINELKRIVEHDGVKISNINVGYNENGGYLKFDIYIPPELLKSK